MIPVLKRIRESREISGDANIDSVVYSSYGKGWSARSSGSLTRYPIKQQVDGPAPSQLKHSPVSRHAASRPSIFSFLGGLIDPKC
jgi:hypothetical protein